MPASFTIGYLLLSKSGQTVMRTYLQGLLSRFKIFDRPLEPAAIRRMQVYDRLQVRACVGFGPNLVTKVYAST